MKRSHEAVANNTHSFNTVTRMTQNERRFTTAKGGGNFVEDGWH